MKRSSLKNQENRRQHSNSLVKHHERRGRRDMNRFARRALIMLVFILMIAILFAGYASLYPVTFTWNTHVLNYNRNSQIDYQVQLFKNDFNNQTSLDMDQTYLKDFTRSFDTTFSYHLQTNTSAILQYRYRIEATLQVLDAANPATVLMTKPFVLQPEITGQIVGPNLQIQGRTSIELADYDEWIEAFADQTSAAVNYVLSVAMVVQTDAQLASGPIQISDAPTLKIPLNQQQFELTRLLTDSQPVPVWQPIRYQLILAPIPFPVYPVSAGICFLLIIIIMTTTCSRPKDRFNKQLHRMLRQARNRLMIIGDKAWEPEWCITASDFRSMVRTAKKLKHPLFCYIDRQSDHRSAYFYIYYGENNYCYTLNGSGPCAKTELPPVDTEAPPEDSSIFTSTEPDDSIPVLPDSDDSPDILLARLKAQSGFNR